MRKTSDKREKRENIITQFAEYIANIINKCRCTKNEVFH